MGISSPRISQLSSPIIVVGMHRSGTTLLTSLLSEVGVEMGQELDRHLEALCFQSINDELLRTNQANWLNPAPFVSRLSDPDFVGHMAKLAERMLKNKMDSFGEIEPGQFWGWKDPRTTLTLPIWQRLFPEAKVVHITRHGVAVGLSLKRRAWRHYLRPRRSDVERMFPLGSFIKGYRLWSDYLQCVENCTSQPGCYQMSYEDLVEDPIGELSALVGLLGISVSHHDLSAAVPQVREPHRRSWLEAAWVGWLFSLDILDSSPLTRWGDDVPR